MSDKEIKNSLEELKIVLKEEKLEYDEVELKKAVDYALNLYQDSKRYKGETTFSHAIHVACIVARLKIGIEPVYAAILHEVTKFKGYSYNSLKEIMGEEIATLVKDASKLYLLNYDGQQEVEAENLRKMFMAIAKDIRVVILKLADRLYNMRNIFEEDKEFQIKKANETMQVYAPIAHRLGMNAIKSELEDLSFSILNPTEYEKIRKTVDKNKEERQAYINKRIEEIKKLLEKEKIKATIYGRPKTFYSIYRKTKINNCSVEDLFDLYAIRVIVDSVKDCYSVLGVIHENYKPMPGRVKDYIAVPKTNMYQSIHTTLFGGEDAPFEIQIRTWDMHSVAEYGVAAHFLYKEGKSKMSESDEKLTWLRKTIEFEQEMGNSSSMSEIKVELFGDEVFVFTPKGEIKSLPKGSTTIDFAYSIHQKIGEQMVGAKINEKMVPITTKLKNTDIVEIITSKTSAGPKRDWLNHVKTTGAKNKIVSFLKKQNKDVNIEKGREILEKEIGKTGINTEDILTEEYLEKVAEKLKYKSYEECLENIGFGILSAKKVLNKLVDEYNLKNGITKEKQITANETETNISKNTKDNIEGVEVEGIDNCLVKYAGCCNPLPGDEIVGYITYGKGVSIHRSDCPNLTGLNIDERKINVKWKTKANASYNAGIVVKANDRTGISMDVIKLIQDMKVKLTGFTAKADDEKICTLNITVEVMSVDELQKVIKNIRKVDSVFEVKRAK